MRIAMYTLGVELMSGKEAAILELVRRSRHDWTVFTSRYVPEATFPELDDLDVVDLRHAWYARHAEGRRGLVADACRRLPGLRLPLEGHDALYVVTAGLDHLLALGGLQLPCAAMCLTPLRLAYDPLMRARYGGGRGFGPVRRAGAAAFLRYDARAWNRLDGVFCISETVRRRLLAPGLVEVDGVEVVYPGVAAEAVVPSGAVGDYFLVPGRINWTKRIELAIDAYRRYSHRPGAERHLRLVIAGAVDPTDADYVRGLRAIVGDDERITFEESPSRERLSELYAGCRAVLFTAVNEDFGIVPLEAGAYGKPAVCIGEGGPTETVVDGETGFLHSDAEGLAQALRRLTEDDGLAARMGAAGRERALDFDWRHFASATDMRLEALARGSGESRGQERTPSV